MDMILDILTIPLVQAVIKILVFVLGFVMAVGTVLTLMERKWMSAVQDRIGPNRANIGKFTGHGALHIAADGVKSLLKEDTVPAGADRFLYLIAPLFSYFPAILVWAVIPFAGPIGSVTFQITDINTGLVFIFAVTSLGVYGAVLGGYASNNKYALLGAIRTSSQMLSYEVFLGLSLIGIFMVYGTVQVSKIVELQNTYWFDGLIPKWGIFTQPLAFFLFFTGMLAEAKRQPFDQPEGESEIIAGYYLEYSGARFSAYMLAEYVSIVAVSAITVTLFFGGYQIPWLFPDGFHLLGYSLALPPVVVALLQAGSFITKTLIFCWLIIIIRWTLPRFRFDQTMDLGWKKMLPLSMANLVVTALVLLLTA
ncbi:MAG: NADH-quinone oxidoreductase subunit H [Deltaproteobacteria bacterium]|nr:NADH-quinone oxidoreductase subunit H [Deltaproteobacteria bacterium]MDH4122018.1 NADH-quinone oxidoreductase subunit H [Deltaproteobacteria bacterium]